MMNKRASMELGISTVVVLVIAMVIIAGGIAFIRGFFNKGEEKLGGAFNIAEFGIQPTSSNPLVLVEGEPSIKSGSDKLVQIGFYNKYNTDMEVRVSFENCVSTAATPDGCESLSPVVIASPLTVKAGEGMGFKTYVAAKCKTTSGGEKNLFSGKYICTIKAIDTTVPDVPLESAQVTITVTS